MGRLQSEKHLTALHKAVLEGKEAEVMGLLASGGVDLEAKSSPTGYTPLLYASRSGHQAIVQRLVQAGADVTAVTVRGNGALHLAAASGDVPTVSYLAELDGVDLLAQNRRGQMALEFATASKSVSVAVLQAILQALAASSIDVDNIQAAAGAAAQQAVQRGHAKGAALLLQTAGPDYLPDLQEAREHDNEDVAFYAVVLAWQQAWDKSGALRCLEEERRQLERERRQLAAAKQSLQHLICASAGVIRQAQQVQECPPGPALPGPQDQQQPAAAAAAAAVAAPVAEHKRQKKRQKKLSS